MKTTRRFTSTPTSRALRTRCGNVRCVATLERFRDTGAALDTLHGQRRDNGNVKPTPTAEAQRRPHLSPTVLPVPYPPFSPQTWRTLLA